MDIVSLQVVTSYCSKNARSTSIPFANEKKEGEEEGEEKEKRGKQGGN